MAKSTLMRHRSPFARDTEPGGGGGQPAPQPQPQPAPAPAPSPAPTPTPTPGQPDISQKPDGVSDAEWAALGDPGKNAIVRERQRAAAAEQALAAERAKNTSKPKPPEPPKPADPPKTGTDGQPDIAALIQQAVQAATAPLLEAQVQRDAESAATRIRDAVMTAAGTRFHDPTDALAHIDLTTLTDGNGQVDQQKVTAALDDLLTRKPHLGKVVDTRRQAPPGTPIGSASNPAAPLDDRVKATLARMQATSGVKFADA
jgi:hypothetical protein